MTAVRELSYMAPVGESRWYSLVVRPRAERKAEEFIEKAGFEPFAPFYTQRRKWSDRTKSVEAPLFPGYVFARFPLERKTDLVRLVPPVIEVVRFGDMTPPVEDDVIETVRAMLASKLPVEVTAIPRIRPKVGQRVRIVGTPFDGLLAIVQEIRNKRTVSVDLEALNKRVTVEIEFLEELPACPLRGSTPADQSSGLRKVSAGAIFAGAH